MPATPPEPRTDITSSQLRAQTFDAFRRWGYLQAQLDPLGQYLGPLPLPELDLDNAFVAEARRIYSGTIGAEFMHIPNREGREWIAERLEGPAPDPDQNHILQLLTRADVFEHVIQSRYLGTKRFSLEGVTALIPFLDELLNRSAELGAERAILGMSHRGRLSVMVNTFDKSPVDIFARFEDVDPRSILGGGDVKYHIGATGEFLARNGSTVALHLVSNPSHLEAVDPVAMGRARARQDRYGGDGVDRVLPVIIHGDAAFAGQGIWAETMNLGSIDGYSVGGGIHIVVNNLIGFTAEPAETNSTRFSTDLAHRLPIPIFHVNAEDPAAVVRIAALAAEYRYQFHTDVVIDLIGYRRHGHSEVDDPTVTQPLRYAKIKNHPPLYELYAKQIGVDISATVKELQTEFADAQKKATAVRKKPVLVEMPDYWSRYQGGPYRADLEVDTGLDRTTIQNIADKLAA
ncbi:MAG: thiamine pyrophosphate-dependent enzyme, partial [Acidobacteriaceae bacterium]